MTYAHEYLLYLPWLIFAAFLLVFCFDKAKDAIIFGLCVAMVFAVSIYCVYGKYSYYIVFDNSPAALTKTYAEARRDLVEIKKQKEALSKFDIEQTIGVIDEGGKTLDYISEAVCNNKIIWCLSILESSPKARNEVKEYIKSQKTEVTAEFIEALNNA